jgi:hypothetical protein
MSGMRKLIQGRRSGALLGLCLAYALAIQALMAGVGLGMSVGSESGPAGLVLCLHAPDSGAATSNRDKVPVPQPQCPFCFVAAQSACHVAAPGAAPSLPAYARLPIAGRLAGENRDNVFVPYFRRTAGDPRAPPSFSI